MTAWQSFLIVLRLALASTMAITLAPAATQAQTAANLSALNGLVPATVLPNTPEGQAALAANYAVTGQLQTGAASQPTLLPFPDQQRLALKDAFITIANGAELADSLGTRLGAAYQSLAHYDGPKSHTSLSPAMETLFAYSIATVGSDANFAKSVLANQTDGNGAPSAVAAAVLTARGGRVNVFGSAYGVVAERAGTLANGNPRPFQSEPSLATIIGADYFGAPSGNAAYLWGPSQDLRDSPTFPSFHATYGYTEAVLLAILVPERYGPAVARAAEYGNHRILLGAHYAMDVIAGRTLALHDLAKLLANDPAYVGQTLRNAGVVNDFQAVLATARDDVTRAMQAACGVPLPVCAGADRSRFQDAAANEAFYDATQTYGLPVVYPATASKVEDVGEVAREAGYLLTAAFPFLTLAQADAILTETEGPGGGFLDDGSAFGLYSRLNLYAAAKKAAALAPVR